MCLKNHFSFMVLGRQVIVNISQRVLLFSGRGLTALRVSSNLVRYLGKALNILLSLSKTVMEAKYSISSLQDIGFHGGKRHNIQKFRQLIFSENMSEQEVFHVPSMPSFPLLIPRSRLKKKLPNGLNPQRFQRPRSLNSLSTRHLRSHFTLSLV